MPPSLTELEARLDVLCDSMGSHAIELRNHLHRNPELSWEEHETQAHIKGWLADLGLSAKSAAKTGLYVDIGEGEAPVVYRADIDALPIDTSGMSRSILSTRPGVSHSCGHDVHATVGAGVAAVFQAIRDDLPGRVRVVFQPAEEVVPSGGEALVEEGVLDGMKAAFALHVDPLFDVGSIGVRAGCLTAASDKFTVNIEGQSGHGARPYLANDALLAATEVVRAFTGLVREHVNPTESAVVTVGLIRAGDADNVVAGQAHMAGSIRTFSPEVRTKIQDEMRRIIRLSAELHNCTGSLGILQGAPSIVNSPFLDNIVRNVGREFLGARKVHELLHPSTGSEDFGIIGTCGPVYMLRLGVRTPGEKVAHLHTPEFFADERAVGVGIKLMSRIVLRALFARLP